MITNADITIYRRIRGDKADTWEREFVPDVWHHSGVKYTPTTEGMKAGANVTNVHTVRIPRLNVCVGVEDYVVIGEGPETMSTVKDLQGFEHFRVTGSNYNVVGSQQHIKVVGV